MMSQFRCVILWCMIGAIIAQRGCCSNFQHIDDDYDDDDDVAMMPSQSGLLPSDSYASDVGLEPSPMMEFRMDKLEDLHEMQYLVEFIDPEHGKCPFPLPMELYFDQDVFDDEYGLETLQVLQDQYRDVLPAMKTAWMENDGAARLDQLEFPEEYYQQASQAQQQQHPAKADNVPFALRDGGEHVIEVPLGAFTGEDSNNVPATIDLSSILAQLSGDGSGMSLGAGVEDLMKGLKIVINGMEVSLDDGNTHFDLSGIINVAGNGGEQEPIVVDLNKALIAKERARYISETHALRSQEAAVGEEQSTKLSPDVTAARKLAEEAAEAEYEHSNFEWVLSSSSSDVNKPQGATPSRRSTNALRLLSALEMSCRAPPVGSSSSSWQCTHEVERVLARITSDILVAEDVYDMDHVKERIATVEAIRDARVVAVEKEVEAMCQMVQTLQLRHNAMHLGDSEGRVASPMDTIVPVVAERLRKLNNDDVDGDNQFSVVENVLTALVEFTESHSVESCSGGAAEHVSAVTRSLWYAAALLRLTETLNESATAAASPHAMSLLSITQSERSGSTNARLALATMREFGFVAEQNVRHATHLIVSVAADAHKNMYQHLEDVYLREANTKQAIFEPKDTHSLRRARSYVRSNGIMFTLFIEDTLEDTRSALESTVVELKERVISTRSTHALYLWVKTLIPMFWGSLRFSYATTHSPPQPPENATTVVFPDHATLNVNCWTWVVGARLFPELLMVDGTMEHVTEKCKLVDDAATIMHSIHNDVSSSSSDDASSSLEDTLKRHVEKSVADSYYYSAAQATLMMLAYQEVLCPCGTEEHCATTTQHSTLQRSKKLLAHAKTLATAVHQEGLVAAEAAALKMLLGVPVKVLQEYPWHVALCLVAIEVEGGEDTLLHSTATSSGFILPEWFALAGLMHHLEGDAVSAARYWLEGGALEVESANVEEERRTRDVDVNPFFWWSTSGPIDATRVGSHGDCLYLLSNIVREQRDVFEAMRCSTRDGEEFPSIPGASVFSYLSSEAYADALIETAAGAPLFHSPSIAKKLRSAAITANDGNMESMLLDVTNEETNKDHKTIVLLADLRNVLPIVHEARTLHMFQWLTDRVAAFYNPITMIEKAQAYFKSLMCSALDWLPYQLFGRCYDWTVDPILGLDSHLVAHQLPTVQVYIDQVDETLRAEVLQSLAAVEAAHFWLLQGSAEALGSIMALDSIATQFTNGGRFDRLQESISLTMSRHIQHMVMEESAALRLSEATTSEQNSSAPLRVRLDHSTPFQYVAPERRFEALGAVAYRNGMRSFRRACSLFHTFNHYRADATPYYCRSPDSAIVRGVLFDSPRSLDYQSSSHKCLSNASHCAAHDAAHKVLLESMNSFAQCSGESALMYFSSARQQHQFVAFQWRDDKSLLLVNPQCALYLALMLNDYGDAVLQSKANSSQEEPPPQQQLHHELLNMTLTAAARLRVFHRYDKAPAAEHGDHEDDEGTDHSGELVESIEHYDAADADDENDPNDERFEASTLGQLRHRSKSKQKTKHEFSIKPAAWMDPNGIRAQGDGHWLSVRRNGIVAGWNAVAVVKELLRWRS